MCKELKTRSFANQKTLKQLEQLDPRKEEEKLLQDVNNMEKKIKVLIGKVDYLDQKVAEKEKILSKGGEMYK